jgi:ribonuclease P protein component
MKSKIVALSKNEDFKNLLKKKKISNKYMTIFFGTLNNKDNKKLNISFVTKKKQIKNSVRRNKVKRRLRNIINEAVQKLTINFNYSYLVIAKITMLNNEYTIIKETLFQDFKKIK